MANPRVHLCLLALVAGLPFSRTLKCPWGENSATNISRGLLSNEEPGSGFSQRFDRAAVQALDFKAVEADLTKLIRTSQSFWPADFSDTGGNYGPLLIRLAWHCSGSYRTWDGRGGCDGGRIRFYPERSWPDNANLDKAIKLLEPVKAKYGAALSWGDLIVLAGNTAIKTMGGPVLGFCAGRMDDVDGQASLPLGPTVEQQAVANCTPGDGNCQQPLGQSTMGLIYVNPEGVMGVPVPNASVPHIRGTFGSMGMNDSETVALIGGGHAFGKTHGACPSGAGPGPEEDPNNPWPGTCGHGPTKGKGNNTFTSGFEGPWTTTPTRWSNQYFHNLLDFDWEVHKGPGGHFQWRPKHKANSPRRDTPLPDIMMLTTDIALLHDPTYLMLVQRFAENATALDEAFSHAWYKLTTRDMGPFVRCLGKDVPPAQPWQRPLPALNENTPNTELIRADVEALLGTTSPAIAPDQITATNSTQNTTRNATTYAPLLTTLAWQCASTYRETDHAGGCNGARLRFAPEKDWLGNLGMDQVLMVLAPIKDKYPGLSWADLIVIAGTVAVESGAPETRNTFQFCLGRSDALEGDESVKVLEPRNYSSAGVEVRDNMAVMGLTVEEGVALAARPRSPSYQRLQGYSGSWAPESPARLSNQYFTLLLEHPWQNVTSPSGRVEFKARYLGRELYMTPADMALRNDPQLSSIARDYGRDNMVFLDVFKKAWFKVMHADLMKPQ